VIPNFDWDLAKAIENRRKHGVSFEEAATVFGDFDALIEIDAEHSEGEDRFIITGISARDRLLHAVYAIRGESMVRIISSRLATPHERRNYETQNEQR
jgi:uncharacterized DUF497 family protein